MFFRLLMEFLACFYSFFSLQVTNKAHPAGLTLSDLTVIFPGTYSTALRLLENAHLPYGMPFGRLTVLSRAEGLRSPHPSSLRRTQKVQGRRWKPLGRELGGERAKGENGPASFVFVSSLEGCALSPAPFTYASFLWILSR